VFLIVYRIIEATSDGRKIRSDYTPLTEMAQIAK